MRDMKRITLVIVSMTILLGIVAVVGIIVFGTALHPAASNTSTLETSYSSPRIMLGDSSLTHVYQSLGELKKSSTLVVLGTVTAQSTAVGNHGVVSTISTFQIERALMSKSTTPTTVLVRQTGGVAPDGTQWVLKDFPLLQLNTRYILFLTPSQYSGVFYPVGAPQGVFVAGSSNLVSSLTTKGLSVRNVPFNTFLQEVESA